jgi:O-antigen ligase
MYLSWVVIYFLLTNIVNTEKKLIVFMLLYFLWCLKMSQFGTRMIVTRGFSFSSWGLTCAPQFFHNSGECGIQLAMFFATSLYFVLGVMAYVSKRTKLLLIVLPATAGISIMGSSSRGAQLALAAILLWMVLRSRHRIRSLVLAAMAAGLFYAIMPEEQKDRFSTMGTDDTSLTRRQYWKDGIRMMNDHPLLGVGFRNWLPVYTRRYNGRYQLPHNVFVEAGSELGYSGLTSFILLILATFYYNYRTRRLASKIPKGSFLFQMAHGLDGALIGFLVGGFFVTVLYYPFFWINLAMTVMLYQVARKSARAQMKALAPAPVPPGRELQPPARYAS